MSNPASENNYSHYLNFNEGKLDLFELIMLLKTIQIHNIASSIHGVLQPLPWIPCE